MQSSLLSPALGPYNRNAAPGRRWRRSLLFPALGRAVHHAILSSFPGSRAVARVARGAPGAPEMHGPPPMGRWSQLFPHPSPRRSGARKEAGPLWRATWTFQEDPSLSGRSPGAPGSLPSGARPRPGRSWPALARALARLCPGAAGGVSPRQAPALWPLPMERSAGTRGQPLPFRSFAASSRQAPAQLAAPGSPT
jgi:hypothetical protein